LSLEPDFSLSSTRTVWLFSGSQGKLQCRSILEDVWHQC